MLTISLMIFTAVAFGAVLYFFYKHPEYIVECNRPQRRQTYRRRLENNKRR